jgi:hypothetical protein
LLYLHAIIRQGGVLELQKPRMETQEEEEEEEEKK